MARNPKTRIEHFIAGREGELPIGRRDPETRIEFFLAGREDELPAGHQEPESRLEHFIKDYRSGGDVTVIPLTVTENGDYTAPEGKAYSPVAVSVALPEDAYIKKSIPSTPTDIANFTDGAEMVMPSLTVGVDAVQDLHGYDYPWVGGAGKNKLQVTTTTQTVGGITFTVNSDGTINVNGTATQNIVLGLSKKNKNGTPLPQGNLIMNGCPSGGSTSSYYLTCWRTNSGNANDVGNGVTFAYQSDWDFKVSLLITSGITCNNLTFKPMIRLATETDATFAPYSNICPIIGWDEANVTVADDVDNPTVENVYTIDLGETRYGGRLEIVNGVARFVATKGYIASYDGETLPSDWISDRDVYSEGTTPTIGAEVVYTLSEPVIIPLGNYPISTLEGENNVFADSGEILNGEYLGGVS